MTSSSLPILINGDTDVITARQQGRAFAARMGFSMIEQVRITTAISELARNIVIYGVRGSLTIHELATANRQGIELVFEDEGPGIADMDQAMVQGYTSGKGLGAGLPGSKRLMDEFEIHNREGGGLYIRACKWK
ncbi:MAG: putative anti-sigma regulatory factor, serine/threonine protein kinase [Cyanobacteria bacterium RYN_339]|nr:putative anti-sigma regulatory factor, serine/threonine protein kinase [Cyanobacteria bacterium RYN_339]